MPEDTLTMCQKYCDPENKQTNKPEFEWYQFCSHQNQEEEQMEKHVIELKQKAWNSESENTENDMLRDKTMFGVTDKSLA